LKHSKIEYYLNPFSGLNAAMLKNILTFTALIMAALLLSTPAHAAPRPLQCAAFSPYVGNLNPDYGATPSPALIDRLLDNLIKKTGFRCIMTYGVLHGLDYTFTAARQRGLKVIAILWIDKDIQVNTQSISRGIALAREFPDTIIKLACGSEVRTRHNYAFDSEITRCLSAMREAAIKQPITTIDIWWEWCNRSMPCSATNFGTQVDWIGINVFPWWENKYSGLYPCIPAKNAAAFHLARLEELQKTYPDKEIVLTEFGWPHAPDQGTEINMHTGQHCGVAGPKNQTLVIRETFKQLIRKNFTGVVFEAYSEKWKPADEGSFGAAWGICAGLPPYQCIPKLP
jgi:exo-beta-1,3-glucanase (GH17 family)